MPFGTPAGVSLHLYGRQVVNAGYNLIILTNNSQFRFTSQIPDPSTVETQQPAVSSSAATDDASAAAAPSTLSSVGIGAGSGSAFRNVSYQRATHESILGENGSSPASKRAATAAVSAARIQPSINAVSDGSGSGLREPQTVGTGAASLNSDETKVIGRGALASAVSS